jgi:hypothetical protein
MRLLLGIGSIIFCLAGQISAAENSLDAPAVPDRPTIRTELRRALQARGGCESTLMNHLPWEPEGNRGVLDYYGCMGKIVSDAAKSGTYSEAFEIGIYFERAVRSSILLSVLEQDARGKQSQAAETLHHFGKIYFSKAIELGEKQHLNLYQICEGVGYEDCQKSVIPIFLKWGWVSASPR